MMRALAGNWVRSTGHGTSKGGIVPLRSVLEAEGPEHEFDDEGWEEDEELDSDEEELGLDELDEGLEEEDDDI